MDNKSQVKRIFEIPHFFKDREGKTARTVLSIEESPSYRDENGFVREGKFTIRIGDEGGYKAFRLSIPEALQLIEILKIATRDQLRKISLLNVERAANHKNQKAREG